MSVPQDSAKNPQGSANKEQKVIVLSMKNMPSFKFDVSKSSLLTSSQDNSQSVFNFKPQQLLQSPTSSQQIQVTTQPKTSNTNIQVASSTTPMHRLTVGTAGTILIRAQSPNATPQQKQTKPQLSLAHPTTIKVQEGGSATQVRKISSEVSLKNAPGTSTVVFHSPSAVKTQVGQIATQKKILLPVTSGTNQAKICQIPAQKVVQKQPVKIFQSTAIKDKPIPILPKPDSQKIVVQQHVILPSTVIVQQSPSANQIKSPNVITIPATGPSYVKYSVSQSGQGKWTVPATALSLPPALTPIQPKLTVNTPANPPKLQAINEKSSLLLEVNEDYESSDSEMLNEECNEKEELLTEKTPEKLQKSEEDDYRMVKRIIEGDGGLQNLPEKPLKEKNMETVSSSITTTNALPQNNNNNNNNNNSMLLCDEQIASVTPDESPETQSASEKAKDQVTPMHTQESANKSQLIEEVKKNLNLDLVSSTPKNDKSDEITRMEIDDNESIVSDDQSNNSSVLKSSLPSTSKDAQNKPKRSRKPKNPTVDTTLGLPYKPPQAAARKKKVEKKVELEMDFHDPLNKIQWEDGIGGLNNCNKLFGFNEFGLIEVLNKKDATAKLKLYEENSKGPDDNSNFKFRKIVDPQDQYVCFVCSKYGTVRDFFSPECCSESCFAITKRKTTELNSSKEDDSRPKSPSSDKRIMFEGEMITLQQLQKTLLESNLPDTSKGKRHGQQNNKFGIPEVKFSWETYLTAKSIPAPETLFNHTSKTATNNFRVGMKLEAIDPMNQHMFCVCTVEEKLGGRIKLHFDGYPAVYDFWTNSDSYNIFPIGFCQSTGRKLNVPQRWSNKKFDWTEYLDHTNSVGAQKYLFPRLDADEKEEECPLVVGMKMEVKHDEVWYAATIIDILKSRLLIRFDGAYEHFGCRWFSLDSPYINYCGGHKSQDLTAFYPPSGEEFTVAFDWDEYLKETGGTPVPKDYILNKSRQPHNFEPGMKLEVVDKVNPQLIRPATILNRNGYKIEVIFDGFDIKYSYWLDDDSEDIHPINYCKETDHPIEHPAGASKFIQNSLCSTNGCRGIGNGKFIDRYFHDTPKECPYEANNWQTLITVKDNSRLEHRSVNRRIRNNEVGEKSSRSLLLNNSRKVKKEVKQEVVKEESMQVEEETTNDTVTEQPAPSRRGRKRGTKRKLAEPKVEKEEEQEVLEEDEDVRKAKIRITQHFLEDYGPQINYAYNLWNKNSKILNSATIADDDLTDNPLKWSVDDVCTYLVKFLDEETAAKFYAEQIDGEALLGLTQKDLVTMMNIKLGPAIKIYNRILWLRQVVISKFTEF